MVATNPMRLMMAVLSLILGTYSESPYGTQAFFFINGDQVKAQLDYHGQQIISVYLIRGECFLIIKRFK